MKYNINNKIIFLQNKMNTIIHKITSVKSVSATLSSSVAVKQNK